MRKALEIFNESQHELNAMLMAIVGRERFPDGLFVGAVSPRLTKLMILFYLIEPEI